VQIISRTQKLRESYGTTCFPSGPGSGCRDYPGDSLPLLQVASSVPKRDTNANKLMFCSHSSSYVYAPFQFLKRYGIKGPQPLPYFGNYMDISKSVCLLDTKALKIQEIDQDIFI